MCANSCTCVFVLIFPLKDCVFVQILPLEGCVFVQISPLKGCVFVQIPPLKGCVFVHRKLYSVMKKDEIYHLPLYMAELL